MLLAAALAVDYGLASRARTAITAVSDAAILSGVRTSTVNRTAGTTNQRETVTSIVRAEFMAHMDSKPHLKAMLTSTTFDTTISNNVMITKICYTAAVNTNLLKLLGLGTISVDNCAQAATSLPTYANIYALVDASGSMGIGASAMDQTLMLSRLGCAFACHTTNWGQPIYAADCRYGEWFSYTTACASIIGAKTRFDVIRQTLIDMIDKASASSQLPDQFKFSVTKFSTRPTEIHAASSNLASVKAAVQSMSLDQAGGGTNLGYALQQMSSKIPPGGDGSSPFSPKVYLIILTDGVEGNINQKCTYANDVPKCLFWGDWDPDDNLAINYPGFTFANERSQVVNSQSCQPYKNNRVNVMTLMTEYITPPNAADARFVMIASELNPVIKSTMQACATSPDMAYSATTPAEIQAAMDKIFKAIVFKARLTS